jgi:D-alanyl-lipoteichoic acid acyltransferase DltB (MBOAT superfamily)
MSIIATCLVLAIFKYFNFLEMNVQALAAFLHWNYDYTFLNIILPIGLSFHTFQSLSYVIEVYRGNQKVERNFGIYSLYVMFYPQLVAGPIERPQNLLHQFYEKHDVDYRRITEGLQRMLWGFFKKIVIADNLAFYVGLVYSNPEGYSGLTLLAATFFFAFQIYCDFSGYSDIAIGAAKVMGFNLMENFKTPYFARSIKEFWSRWHISLSTWFRD